MSELVPGEFENLLTLHRGKPSARKQPVAGLCAGAGAAKTLYSTIFGPRQNHLGFPLPPQQSSSLDSQA